MGVGWRANSARSRSPWGCVTSGAASVRSIPKEIQVPATSVRILISRSSAERLRVSGSTHPSIERRQQTFYFRISQKPREYFAPATRRFTPYQKYRLNSFEVPGYHPVFICNFLNRLLVNNFQAV